MEAEPEGADEDQEGRSDWFTFQRSYPSNSIPPDARLRAWESQPEYQISSDFHQQATETWHAIGPSPTQSAWSWAWGLTSGRVNSIAVSPTDANLVIVGSSTGGIWRSTDAGSVFVPVSDDQVDLAVGSITFSLSNPSIVYAGMGDAKQGYLGSGVLKSTDAGASWTRVGSNSLPSPGTIGKVDVDPTNPNRVFVAQYSRVAVDKIISSGVFLSTDGGSSWRRVLAGAARDVAVDPSNPAHVYAGLSRIDNENDPLFGLYRSTDGGNTWSSLFTAQYDVTKRRDIRVVMSPAGPGTICSYFGGFIGSAADARFKLSTDQGSTWSERNLAAVDTAQLGYNTYLAVDPRDAHTVYIGSRDVYRSTDAGTTWTNLTHNFYDSGAGFEYAPGGSNSHTDQHALAFSSNPNDLYLGNDGGVSKSTDGGASFQSLNSTLGLTQFIGLSVNPTNPAISYGGTQDNGTQQRSANSANWTEFVSGDGGHTVINPVDPSVVFTTYIRGDVFRFSNDGQTFDSQVAANATFGESFDTPRIAFYPPFVNNGVDGTIYFGTWRLFISLNLGNSWFAPGGFTDLTKGSTQTGRDVLSAIGVGRGNTNVIYTGSAQGRVMVTTNRGLTWTDVTRGLPDRSVTSVTVDPVNSAIAYVTVSGFAAGHVFKTTDTGGTWLDISGSVPDVPANALLVDPSDSNTIYLGTDIGVFRSTSRGSSWRSFNRGMPPVVIHEFSAARNGTIQVATYGRGAYELGGGLPPAITAVTFNGKKQLAINGTGFGDAPMVFVNGTDRTSRLDTSTDTSIVLAGKVKKLGLKSGENTVEVVTSDNLSSNVFTVTVIL